MKNEVWYCIDATTYNDVIRLTETLASKHPQIVDLLNRLENAQKREISPKRREAARRLGASKKTKNRAKIVAAIEALRQSGQPVTKYRVAKVTGLSYQTVSRHFADLNANAKDLGL